MTRHAVRLLKSNKIPIPKSPVHSGLFIFLKFSLTNSFFYLKMKIDELFIKFLISAVVYDKLLVF